MYLIFNVFIYFNLLNIVLNNKYVSLLVTLVFIQYCTTYCWTLFFNREGLENIYWKWHFWNVRFKQDNAIVFVRYTLAPIFFWNLHLVLLFIWSKRVFEIWMELVKMHCNGLNHWIEPDWFAFSFSLIHKIKCFFG